MEYQEIIVTFENLNENQRDNLVNEAINTYGCLGVEELNIDFESLNSASNIIIKI